MAEYVSKMQLHAKIIVGLIKIDIQIGYCKLELN